MNGVTRAWVLAILSLPLLSVAQQTEKEKVLDDGQVTVGAVVEALSPSNPSAPPSPGTRLAKPQAPPGVNLMILFETKSAQLTLHDKQKLDIVGEALNTKALAGYHFVVEGHADRRGTHEGNQRLSQQRAEAVRAYLVQAQGVAPDRLKPVGKGDRQPLNKKNPAAPENRRVKIVNH